VNGLFDIMLLFIFGEGCHSEMRGTFKLESGHAEEETIGRIPYPIYEKLGERKEVKSQTGLDDGKRVLL
jgi:hypothetical protein